MKRVLTSKLGFFLVLRMTQDCTMRPPHSTCRLGEVTLAIWKLFRLRNPHAKIYQRSKVSWGVKKSTLNEMLPQVTSEMSPLSNKIALFSLKDLYLHHEIIKSVLSQLTDIQMLILNSKCCVQSTNLRDCLFVHWIITSIAVRCRTGRMPCGTMNTLGSLWGGG